MPIWKGDTYWCDNAALARFLDIALSIAVVRMNGLLLWDVDCKEVTHDPKDKAETFKTVFPRNPYP
jgi:hypothetical protein